MGPVFKSALFLCTLCWKAAEEGKTKRKEPCYLGSVRLYCYCLFSECCIFAFKTGVEGKILFLWLLVTIIHTL